MKFGVVIFPGSNCDQDIIHVLRNILKQEVVELWHKDHDLQGCEFIVLPGGFSYGDYLRSGAIARFSPIMDEVIAFANKGGYVLGICNGFQILCEAGLLPGALLHNNSRKFICKNVLIRPDSLSNILTSELDHSKGYKIPIAHAEGNFYASPEVINSLIENDQILFRYCDNEAQITADSNPNGSVENIAGVCNVNKNVFGLMPHPERAADYRLNNTDGQEIFEGLLSMAMADQS
jgi:phosphoribosylformylglycinamidine synthase